LSGKVWLALGAAGIIAFSVPAAAGAASGGSTIKACANKQTGMLRIVIGKKGCSKRERQVSWSKVGPAGPKGDPGAQGGSGAPGVAGAQGAQGPGATSLMLVAPQDSTPRTLINTGDELITGSCSASTVAVRIEAVQHSANLNPLDISGLTVTGTTVTPFQSTGFFAANPSDASLISLDYLLRHEDTGKLYWLKLFAQRRATDCRYWGLLIPGT
jgi:hypothetical protein